MALGSVAGGYLYNLPTGGGGGPSADVLRFNYRFYPIVLWSLLFLKGVV